MASTTLVDASYYIRVEVDPMRDDVQPNWSRLVDQHGKQVFRIALRVLGSVHDAEDVSQEVFVEAHRLHGAGSVQSWTGLLRRLATLRAIDRLRQIRPMNELYYYDHVSNVEPFEEVMARELAQRIRAAIAELPDQQAAVFTMVHFEQLSREEVAENLEISPDAVSTALYKARQRLLSHLAIFNGGGPP